MLEARVVATATSPVAGGPASALTQTSFGGACFSPNAIRPGQSFSTINALAVGPSTVAFGSMGAGYGGAGQPLTYRVAANLIVNANGGAFLVDLIAPTSIGAGFNSATFRSCRTAMLLKTSPSQL